MNVLKGLLRSRKFWLAVVGVIQTVVFNVIPDFPAEVWHAVNTLLLAVIAGIAIEDAAEKVGKNNVKILPAALEGGIASMREGWATENTAPPISGPAWDTPPPASPRVTPPE